METALPATSLVDIFAAVLSVFDSQEKSADSQPGTPPPAPVPDKSPGPKRALSESAPDTGRSKRRRVEFSYIDLTLDDPSEVLTKVLRADMNKYKGMEKSEQREEIKGYLTKKSRRAKDSV